MRRLFIAAVMAAFLFPSAAAFAQGSVLQCGVVTPGHIAMWSRNGCISDGGAFIPLLSTPNTWTAHNTFAGGETVTGGIGATFQSQVPATFSSNVSMASTLNVAGATTLGAGLTLTGALNSPTTAGQITGTWGGSPTMAGNWTFLGNVALDGSVTLSPTGNITIGGNLVVVGTSTLGGGGSIAGNFSGAPNFTGALTLSGTPSITNGASLTGTFSGNPTASGLWTFNNGMFVGAATSTPFLVLGSAAASAPVLSIEGAAGTIRSIAFQSGGQRRWRDGANSATESGGNTGSDYILQRFDDSNVLIDTPLTISRSTGAATFADAVTLNGSGTGLTVTNNALVSGTLTVTGGSTFTGQVKAPSGSAAAPGVAFSADPATGMYLPAAGQLGLTAAGALKADYGLTNSGQWTFSPAVQLTNTGIALTAQGNVIVGGGVTSPQLTVGNASTSTGTNLEIQGPSGTVRRTEYVSGTGLRWTAGTDNVAESGGNAGTNWLLQRFDDSGTLLDSPIQVDRSSGRITLPDPLLLGATGATNAVLKFLNTSTGSISVVPPSGPLGSAVLTLPDVTSTIASLAAQTFTGTQTFPDATAISSAGIALGAWLKPHALTVATLPTCNSGAKGETFSVTDASAPTYGATLTGGSTVFALAVCDGTNWTAH